MTEQDVERQLRNYIVNECRWSPDGSVTIPEIDHFTALLNKALLMPNKHEKALGVAKEALQAAHKRIKSDSKKLGQTVHENQRLGECQHCECIVDVEEFECDECSLIVDTLATIDEIVGK